MALRLSIWAVSTVLLVLAFSGCASAPVQLPMLCRSGRVETGETVLYCKPVKPLREAPAKPADDEPEKPRA